MELPLAPRLPPLLCLPSNCVWGRGLVPFLSSPIRSIEPFSGPRHCHPPFPLHPRPFPKDLAPKLDPSSARLHGPHFFLQPCCQRGNDHPPFSPWTVDSPATSNPPLNHRPLINGVLRKGGFLFLFDHFSPPPSPSCSLLFFLFERWVQTHRQSQ